MKMAGKFGGNLVSYSIFSVAIVLFALLGIVFFKDNHQDFQETQPIGHYAKISATSKFPTDTILVGKTRPVSLPVTISAKNNFENYETTFLIPRDTLINVFGVGEAADFSTNPDLFWSFDNDGIELFFDMHDDKAPFFDSKNDDRQYRILWKTNQIFGQNIVRKGVEITENDLSDNAYSLTLIFPWKTLGFFKPGISSRFGFDIGIMDSDDGSKKSMLNWASNSPDNWKNTSYYGTVLLSKNAANRSNATKIALAGLPLQSGRTCLECFDGPIYQIKNLTVGTHVDDKDCSGSFQLKWDQTNFYVKVNVKDNQKSLANAIFDYGWIEDVNGIVIWKMKFSNMRPAGGSLKNVLSKGIVYLRKGVYKLKYHTDESHAPNKWDDLPPTRPFYGIKLSFK